MNYIKQLKQENEKLKAQLEEVRLFLEILQTNPKFNCVDYREGSDLNYISTHDVIRTLEKILN